MNEVDTPCPPREPSISPDSLSWLAWSALGMWLITRELGQETHPGAQTAAAVVHPPGPLASWFPSSHRPSLLSQVAQALPAQLPGHPWDTPCQEGPGAQERG